MPLKTKKPNQTKPNGQKGQDKAERYRHEINWEQKCKWHGLVNYK